MTKSPSANASKINKTANEKSKATAVVTSNNKEKEKKGNDKELNENKKMAGRGGRGAAVAAGRGRGNEPEEATRKRKSKDSFDDKHEKNLANVYAVWNKKQISSNLPSIGMAFLKPINWLLSPTHRMI